MFFSVTYDPLTHLLRLSLLLFLFRGSYIYSCSCLSRLLRSTPRPHSLDCHCKPRPPLYTGSFNLHIQIHYPIRLFSPPLPKTSLSWILWAKQDLLLRLSFCAQSLCSAMSDSQWPQALYVACQAPLSMGVHRQEDCTERVAISYPWGSSGPRTEPTPLVSPALASGFFTLVAQLLKNPPAMWVTWVQSAGWEDALQKETATQSSILTWRIPWTEEEKTGRLQSMGPQRGGHGWVTFTFFTVSASW